MVYTVTMYTYARYAAGVNKTLNGQNRLYWRRAPEPGIASKEADMQR